MSAKALQLTTSLEEPRDSQRPLEQASSTSVDTLDQPIDLETKARETALESFIAGVQERFEDRLKGFSYNSPQWDFRQPSGQTDSKGRRLVWQDVHKTKVVLSRPNLVEEALTSLHKSFGRAARAVLGDLVLQNRSKRTDRFEASLRLLAHLAPPLNPDLAAANQSLNPKPLTLHELRIDHLQHVERAVVTNCLTPEIAKALKKDRFSLDHVIVTGVQMRGAGAFNARKFLLGLYDCISVLQRAKIISPMNARLGSETSDLLIAIEKEQAKAFRDQKGAELEPGIAALSDAITAMADDDPRLSSTQKAVLCVMGLEMCAPSRINEVMTMSIHDRLRAVETYGEEPVGSDAADGEPLTMTESKLLHSAHAGIKEASVGNPLDDLPNTVLMKGSKGAAWGAKPLLDFMLVMFNECFDRLVEMGSRSRMLIQHYEKHPTTLYLPPKLEHLRGRPLTATQVGRIMLHDYDLISDKSEFVARGQLLAKRAQYIVNNSRKARQVFTLEQRPDLVDQVVDDQEFFVQTHPAGGTAATASDLPHPTGINGKLPMAGGQTEYMDWSSVEAELLRRVNRAMDSIRWVGTNTRYKGRLSSMLVLFDHLGRSHPYLPGALSAHDVAIRLKSMKVGGSPGAKRIQTVFEALDLTMPMVTEGGTKIEIVPAYCRSHDPRRWLTTMALRHAGPQLSRLLINLWANRADAGQLSRYEYSTPEQKATRTAMEVPQAMREIMNEHEDLSQAFADELIGEYGLKTHSVSVGLHAIRVTTMEAIHAAEQNHPVAKAGGKLILVFPTPYGACLHQHYEVGCTNYRGCGGACSDQRVVKGHLPTNEQVRKRSKELNDVIVAQVRRLILSRNRGVVHDVERLDEHITRMIQQHMDAEEIAQRLIAEFHQIKDLIKDAAFKADLEDAFAFKGTVEKLDDPECPSGAVIRYYNPERHGRPEAERSLEALGGRQAIDAEVKTFLQERDWMRLANRAANDADDDADAEDDDAPENGNGLSDESHD